MESKETYPETEVLDLCNKAYMQGQADMKKRCLTVLHGDTVGVLNQLMSVFTDYVEPVKRQMPALEIHPLKLSKTETYSFESLLSARDQKEAE